MKLLRIFYIAALGASGCTTSPVPLSEALAVPSTRVFYKNSGSEKTATATFVRDSGFFGGGIEHLLLIDEEKVATIKAGEKLVINIPAGDLLIGIKAIDPLGIDVAPVTIEQHIDPSKNYLFRISVDTYGVRIQRVLGKKMD